MLANKQSLCIHTLYQLLSGLGEPTKAAELWKWRVIKVMGSSDHSLFNFLQLWVPIQQKQEAQGDALLMKHIFVKHQQRRLTSPRLVGTCAWPVPRYLYAHKLWMILTWIRRKLFVPKISRQPFVGSNVLCGKTRGLKRHVCRRLGGNLWR